MQLAPLQLFALRRIHISDSINPVNRLNVTLSLLPLKYTHLDIIEEYIITVFLRNFQIYSYSLFWPEIGAGK